MTSLFETEPVRRLPSPRRDWEMRDSPGTSPWALPAAQRVDMRGTLNEQDQFGQCTLIRQLYGARGPDRIPGGWMAAQATMSCGVRSVYLDVESS